MWSSSKSRERWALENGTFILFLKKMRGRDSALESQLVIRGAVRATARSRKPRARYSTPRRTRGARCAMRARKVQRLP